MVSVACLLAISCGLDWFGLRLVELGALGAESGVFLIFTCGILRIWAEMQNGFFGAVSGGLQLCVAPAIS